MATNNYDLFTRLRLQFDWRGAENTCVASHKNVTIAVGAVGPDPDAPPARTSDRSLGDIEETGGPSGVGVTALEGELGSDAYRPLLVVFLGQLQFQLAELRNAAVVGDVPAARYVAHQFKGTASGFGAVHLDELADRLLGVGRDQAEILRSVVDEVSKEIGRLQAVLGPYATRA